MRHSIADRRSSIRGITLIEVVVIIFALLLLAALVLPAIQHANGPRRRHECLSNLKNLGLATNNYASVFGGALPHLLQPAPGLASNENAIWALALLPYLDRADTHEYILQATNAATAKIAVSEVLGSSGARYAVLQCPNDVNHFKVPGGLSYGANIGYGAWHGTGIGVTRAYDFHAIDHSAASFDWNSNGKLDEEDKEMARATGVFWVADKDKFRMTMEHINNGDGTSSTILFAESLDIPPMHLTGPAKNGRNPAALEVGIGLGINALGLSKHATPQLFVDSNQKPTDEFQNYFKPNAMQRSAEGSWLGASSPHRGAVNVVFAGGNTSTISTDINWAVWASLHSPTGVNHGQVEISEDAY